MKKNKLSPGQNIMWESSRMMLPEHKERIQEHRNQLCTKQKPLLDEQQMQQFSERVLQAVSNNLELTAIIFHPFGNKKITGRVVKVDSQSERIKLANREEMSWITLNDVVDITVE